MGGGFILDLSSNCDPTHSRLLLFREEGAILALYAPWHGLYDRFRGLGFREKVPLKGNSRDV